MKLFAPAYYRRFFCIADKCKHSCCIGWEIDVDEKSERKYSLLQAGYGEKIKESIDYSDTPHFALGENGRCPHLDALGLCRIITELGEDYLCDICRLHPRFYNFTSDRAEVGLGMACEVAAELILSSDGYLDISEIGEYNDCPGTAKFDILTERDKIFGIISDRSVPYCERLKRIYKGYGVSPSEIKDEEWRELILSLEYLEDGSRVKFSRYTSDVNLPESYDVMLERALAYFIFRHLSEACDGTEVRRTLGACLFLERLLAFLIFSEGANGISDVSELARIISSELEYSEDNMEEIKMTFI